MIFDHLLALFLGFLLDLIIGDPTWFRHPVCFIGDWISWLEKRLRASKIPLKIGAMILTLSTAYITVFVVGALLILLGFLGRIPLLIGMTLMYAMGLATNNLAYEAKGVAKALERGLEDGRKQVARIVGRDTQSLSEKEIICATIETVAENTTDGVISPLFYALLGGPIALWAFKAVSTLDSMVGYLDPKYRDIGWSSAKLDDVLNFIPARLTALLLCVAAAFTNLDAKNAWRIVKRDHTNHLSPNCAWSESAAAGALHIQLGGTHRYFGKTVFKPTIGDNDRPVEVADIDRTCDLLYVSASLMMALVLLAGSLLLLSVNLPTLPYLLLTPGVLAQLF